jgi:hypothetical protein
VRPLTSTATKVDKLKAAGLPVVLFEYADSLIGSVSNVDMMTPMSLIYKTLFYLSPLLKHHQGLVSHLLRGGLLVMARRIPTNPDTTDWTLSPQQEISVDLKASREAIGRLARGGLFPLSLCAESQDLALTINPPCP